MKRLPQLRHSPDEKRELIYLVEHSVLPVRRTLEALGLAPSTFYRWYAQFQEDGEAGLAPKSAAERQFWNRIPDSVQRQLVKLALDHPEKSPRELAWHFTDRERYSLGESAKPRPFSRGVLSTHASAGPAVTTASLSSWAV
jgi:transposase-like protein